MNFIKNKDYRASIVITDKFFCINTESGYGLVTIDPNYPSIILPLDSANDELGKKVIQALEKNNTHLNDEEYNNLFKKENMKKNGTLGLKR